MSQLREFARRLEAAKRARIEPSQPTEAPRPPRGPGWLHELKFDGYRLMVARDGDRVRCITKNGYDWANRYPTIVEEAKELKATSFTIDGEVVMSSGDGQVDFNALRSGFARKQSAILVAFDLLTIDGEDLRGLPLIERKERLASLLKPLPAPGRKVETPWIQLCKYIIDEDGPLVFEKACAMGCEGIVSKRLASPYKSGRSRSWIKSKNPASVTVKREQAEDWNGRKTRRP